MSKLGLGTAQLGMNYGVANETGKINFLEAKKIFQLAKDNNINLIDTAITYGDSQKVIGEAETSNFNIVSKLPCIPEKNLNVDIWINNLIKESLNHLKVNSLYGLLLHQPKNLLGDVGKKLIDALYKIKSNGLVKKIGISVYDCSEIEQVIDLFAIDIVQAPLNIIDRRIETSGWLSKLSQAKIEVHTRSTFLQGLLLMPNHKIPSKFKKWKIMWDRWFYELKKYNLNAAEVCLSYPLSLAEIDRVIVGVDNFNQLNDLIKMSQYKPLKHDWSFMKSNDNLLINPNNWNLL
tara:strand:- start:1796 stop:2668 length:873 start_codon:yes stop_codon:yes gene_type:complete